MNINAFSFKCLGLNILATQSVDKSEENLQVTALIHVLWQFYDTELQLTQMTNLIL